MFVVAAVLGAALLAMLFWTNRNDASATQQTAAPAAPAPSRTLAPAAAGADRAAVQPARTAAAPEPESTLDPAARVAAALAASRAAAAAAEHSAVVPAAATPLSLEDVISRSMPAVVRVEAGSGFGTGFFVAPDTILTNVHVVSGNSTVTIRRPGGATQSAHVEFTAPELDIAVMRVSSPDPNQPTLTMGSGMHARAGQEVITLGTPMGLQNTVTRGIVSAVREVGGLTLVQTDAAVNPGNSGGPLGDRYGRKYVLWFSILGALPFTLALPYAGLAASAVLTVFIGLILSSATSSIIVFAQELMPHRFGMISGVFFGVAFGIGGLGAAVLGKLADHTGIAFVYHLCSFLPALGLLAVFLPKMPRH